MKTRAFSILLIMLASSMMFASNPNELQNTKELELAADAYSEHTHPPAQMQISLSSTAQKVATGDSMALVALYNSANGRSWSFCPDWLSRLPISRWYGVTVTNGRVTELYLEMRYMRGTLPAEIGNLTELKKINLSSNYYLGGSIPAEFGNCENLQELILDRNDLSGSIPPELGNLKKITRIDVSDNNLSGSIPPELGNLKTMIRFDANNNNLSGSIPSELTNWADLETIRIEDNDFVHIPDFSKLTKLKRFDCDGNRLTFGDIEPNIGVLTSYAPQAKVEISGPAVAYIKESITLSVDVDGTANAYQWYKNSVPISGAIQNKLTIKSVAMSDFANYHCVITNSKCPALTLSSQILKISRNTNVAARDSLALVALYKSTNGANWTTKTNWLTSQPIEKWHGVGVEIKNVTSLYLNDNNLTGTLPAELGNLLELKKLSLYRNHLTGNIPAELGKCVKLFILDLSGNKLSGSFPAELGNLQNLMDFYIQRNALSGSIPPGFANMQNLYFFDITNNHFVDIPDFSKLKNIHQLGCYYNRLTFEDIEPNISVREFSYAIQDSVDINGQDWIPMGGPMTLSVDVGGSVNKYRWFKDSVLIPGADKDEFTLDSVAESDLGVYRCEITNENCHKLILSSRLLDIDKNTLGAINIIVWHDANENGKVDEGEKGLPDIAIRIPLQDKTVKHLTNSSGKTTFTSRSGTALVQLLAEFLPQGAVCTTGGLQQQATLDENNRVTTVYFGFSGETVAQASGDPVNRPAEQQDDLGNESLVLVDGSVTQDNGKTSCGWSNTVDGDEEGWDGTTLAMPDADSDDSVPWAIFKFADEQAYKFNYIKFLTDNGTDDDGAKKIFPACKIEVLVSTTGTEAIDFSSIGIFKDKYSTQKMQWCKLNEYVTARYIKLRLLEPIVPAHWTEIVEFGVDTSDKTGPVPASQDQEIAIVPENASLLANYPNPFNPSTNIVYQVEKEAQVSVRIYDIVGKQVAELVHENQAAGQYEITWHAGDLPSGVYFVTMQTGNSKLSKRILLMK